MTKFKVFLLVLVALLIAGYLDYRNMPKAEPTVQPTIQAVEQPQKPDVPQYTISEKESEVLHLVNKTRIENGLHTLSMNQQLYQAAHDKAQDMQDNHYFEHTSPQGVNPWHWVSNAGYRYIQAGENLAINYPDTTSQHIAWLNSPEHKKVMLNPNYAEAGVAVIEKQLNNKVILTTVMLFGQPKL